MEDLNNLFEDHTKYIIIWYVISLISFIVYLVLMCKCVKTSQHNLWNWAVAVLIWTFLGPVGLIFYHIFLFASSWADKQAVHQGPVQGFNPAILVPETPTSFNVHSEKVTFNSGPFVPPGPVDSTLPYPNLNTQEPGSGRSFIPMMYIDPPNYNAAVGTCNVQMINRM